MLYTYCHQNVIQSLPLKIFDNCAIFSRVFSLATPPPPPTHTHTNMSEVAVRRTERGELNLCCLLLLQRPNNSPSTEDEKRGRGEVAEAG